MSLTYLRREVRKLRDQIGTDRDIGIIETIDLHDWSKDDVAVYDALDLAGQLGMIEERTGHRPEIHRDNPVIWIEVRPQRERDD